MKRILKNNLTLLVGSVFFSVMIIMYVMNANDKSESRKAIQKRDSTIAAKDSIYKYVVSETEKKAIEFKEKYFSAVAERDVWKKNFEKAEKEKEKFKYRYVTLYNYYDSVRINRIKSADAKYGQLKPFKRWNEPE